LRAKADANPCLFLVRNSLGGSDFLAHAISDVLLSHHHGRMPKVITRLHYVATRFGLVRTCLGA